MCTAILYAPSFCTQNVFIPSVCEYSHHIVKKCSLMRSSIKIYLRDANTIKYLECFFGARIRVVLPHIVSEIDLHTSKLRKLQLQNNIKHAKYAKVFFLQRRAILTILYSHFHTIMCFMFLLFFYVLCFLMFICCFMLFYVLACKPECSVLTCAELGIDPNEEGSSEVCAESGGAGLGGCSGDMMFEEAIDFCVRAGLRLCTCMWRTQNQCQNFYICFCIFHIFFLCDFHIFCFCIFHIYCFCHFHTNDRIL